ncbi:hypothetical protein ABTX77_27030 [Streptomyces sp. NPDC097704]|uniref:hypothetical protein n=1 Tax=Streptomyces sp. NPDC097704 TaxID=3157101 RepID=UPI0033335727
MHPRELDTGRLIDLAVACPDTREAGIPPFPGAPRTKNLLVSYSPKKLGFF